MKNNKRVEIAIVILLSILCLTGILFAVKTSRDTGDEVLPQEGTALNNPVSTEVSTEETEVVEEITEETETTEIVEESTEESTEETTEESTEETTEETEIPFKKGEPLSEKDLEFPFLGYNTYIEYIAAGNTGSVYMLADNANMITSGEFVDEGDVVESTVRGIKLGDNIAKVFELYGQADEYDTYERDLFSHDDREDVDQYLYFLKIDSTKDYLYSFRFITDQYGDLIGFILEPLDIKYWTGDFA